MFSFVLQKNGRYPLYAQLYRQIAALILGGELPAGTKLPPSRQLAVNLGVARVTVTQAYEQLQAEGYIAGRIGAGMFVTEGLVNALLPKREEKRPFTPTFSHWGERVMAAEPEVESAAARPAIDFGFGRSFAQIFPYDVWRRLLARYLGADDAILARYGSVAGFEPLRAALADYLARQRGVRCTPEQIVIVSGAQQVLDILARLLLNPGDEALVETPGYTVAYDLLRVYGARLVGLPVDDEGFRVELIPQDSRARLAFVTPTHQFPRGGTMSLPRRLRLLQWAQEREALIIEDDYDGELRYNGRPLAALQGLDEAGRVAYLGTFSKVLFPALRLAYVVLPPALLNPFVQAKSLIDRGAPTLTQAAVADFITEGHFERHLQQLRQAYGRRRAVLIAAIAAYIEPNLPQVRYAPMAAGLHVMLYLGTGVNETAVVQQAAAAGVGVYPGAPYHLEQPAPPSILLGFSGLEEAEIEEGVRRLAKVLPAQA
ncbi:MAG: PLP-dependent aminotransferase family protein [Chloroflexi bacterium]|nr:PLP-dependent aminotransferase family protein [Chloroflexota bacterium]